MGFSAYKGSQNVTTDIMITEWSTVFPEFSGNYFDAFNGIYTVPQSGVYAVQATISYVSTQPIITLIGADVNPAFDIRKISPAAESLVVGNLPIFYTQMLRTVLTNSTITLTGIVQLNQGNTLGLFYNADGLTVPFILTIQWNVIPLFSTN